MADTFTLEVYRDGESQLYPAHWGMFPIRGTGDALVGARMTPLEQW